MLERIHELAALMKDEILKAGVKESRYDRICLKYSKKHPEKVLEFLEFVHEVPYAHLVYVRGLIAPHMWEMQVSLNAQYLPEQTMMRAAQSDMRQVFSSNIEDERTFESRLPKEQENVETSN